MALTRWTVERAESVRHWTDSVLSLRVTRDPAYRFEPGHYARLALPAEGAEPVWRAFSMVSAPMDPALEFLAVLVTGGAFSSALRSLGAGDRLLVDRAAYGFLTLGALAPGRDLWLVASGTGIGPFVSMLRDGRARRRFERVFVVHSVRRVAELAYRDEIEALGREAGSGPDSDACDGASQGTSHGTSHGESAGVVRYLPVVTRESVAGTLSERVPRLLADGRLEAVARAEIEPQRARVMVCGNPEMAADMRRLLTARGLRTARRGVPGQMAFENYW